MQTTTPSALRPRAITPTLLLLTIGILASMGIALVLRFSEAQEQREMTHWQNKLGLIADSRSADISNWLDTHLRELSEVASNPSLQLYLTVLLAPKPVANAVKDEPAQQVFLRNLLIVTADKLGFISQSAQELNAVHANVRRATGTGIAIMSMDGKIIVSTEGLATLEPSLISKITSSVKNQPSLIDIFPVPSSHEKRMGFILPIYAIQGEKSPAQQIGMLVAIKAIGEDLLRLLAQPGASEKTLEAMLLRKNGTNVEYLVPTESHEKLASSFSLTTPNLDAAYALTNPATFAVKHDRQSRTVLMTSRSIAGSPWTLLLHIDRDQALAESDSWRIKMEIIMLLGLLVVIASIIAAWWYGMSKRALSLSFQTGRLAAHAMAQERLLRLVADNQPEPIFITDSKHFVRFANDQAAKLFNLTPAHAFGKDLMALLGKASAQSYIHANIAALEGQKSIFRTQRIGEDENTRILRSEHIPLPHIPIDSLPYPSPGVLVVEQDVTEIMHERERRERILRELVATLIQMVDARDPHAANHSASVAMVAKEVALSLEIDPTLVETAEIAGNLMNIGKIIVPTELLTKRTQLAKDEMQTIRESLASSVSLIEKIDFDGPVAETLRQAAERYDGCGTLGLSGEGILITARIIAVTNSFIGMISPRAWRPAHSIEQATSLLLENIDTQFDRRIVIALINFVENKNGRQKIEKMVNNKGNHK